MNRIVLLGFPGCGKSTYGRRLAGRLGYEFYDLDKQFESFYHISVFDFFKKYGEDVFRMCEKKLLGELLLQDRCVISVGGGTPCFYDSMDKILQNSFSIYIKLSEKSLFVRLSNSKMTRPLLARKTDDELMTYICNTLISRENFYSRAHVTVKGEGLAVDDLVSLVKSGLKIM